MSNASYRLAARGEHDATESRIGCCGINLCPGRAKRIPGAETGDSLMAVIRLDTDVSSLFPYINATMERGRGCAGK